MSQHAIVIHSTGPHTPPSSGRHLRDRRADDNSAEQIAAEAVQQLRARGHVVHSAELVHVPEGANMTEYIPVSRRSGAETSDGDLEFDDLLGDE